MFACKHVLFFVTQIYSLLFCHADFADDADLFFFTQSFLRRCRRFFLNFRLVCPTRPGLGASALYLSLRPVTVGSGRVGQILLLSFTFPLGVPPDLESGVKKCPNLFRLCGFAIRSKGECISLLLCWGDYKSPGFNRSNLFLRRISNPPGRPYHLHRITIPPYISLSASNLWEEHLCLSIYYRHSDLLL